LNSADFLSFEGRIHAFIKPGLLATWGLFFSAIDSQLDFSPPFRFETRLMKKWGDSPSA
jgi:hypothetical protein